MLFCFVFLATRFSTSPWLVNNSAPLEQPFRSGLLFALLNLTLLTRAEIKDSNKWHHSSFHDVLRPSRHPTFWGHGQMRLQIFPCCKVMAMSHLENRRHVSPHYLCSEQQSTKDPPMGPLRMSFWTWLFCLVCKHENHVVLEKDMGLYSKLGDRSIFVDGFLLSGVEVAHECFKYTILNELITVVHRYRRGQSLCLWETNAVWDTLLELKKHFLVDFTLLTDCSELQVFL